MSSHTSRDTVTPNSGFMPTYIRPAHRAPAGVVEADQTPAPPRSAANDEGGTPYDYANGLSGAPTDGRAGVATPTPATTANGHRLIYINTTEARRLQRLSEFVEGRVLQYGSSVVSQGVQHYISTFHDRVLGSGTIERSAINAFSLETGTPETVALMVFSVVARDAPVVDIAMAAEAITELYAQGRPSPTSTSSAEMSGMMDLMKGMAAALAKTQGGEGPADFTAARKAIVDNEPPFYTDLPTVDYGGAAIPLNPWRDISLTAPLDRQGLIARPLVTPGKLAGMLAGVTKDPSLYPQTYNSMLVDVGTLYAYNLGTYVLEKMPVADAVRAADADAARVVTEACRSVPGLRADVLEVARTQSGDTAVLIRALSRHFAPVTIMDEAVWWRLDAKPGETLAELFARIRDIAARQDKPYHELTRRMDTILFELCKSPSATSMVAVIANDFKNKHQTAYCGADLAKLLHGETLHMTALVKAAPPGGGGALKRRGEEDPLTGTLITRSAKVARNVILGFDAYKLAKGADFNGGIIPPPKVVDECPFCVLFGVTSFKAWIENDTDRPNMVTTVYKHNPWKCAKYEKFVNELCKECPDANIDAAACLRAIDNPMEVARAEPRVAF